LSTRDYCATADCNTHRLFGCLLGHPGCVTAFLVLTRIDTNLKRVYLRPSIRMLMLHLPGHIISQPMDMSSGIEAQRERDTPDLALGPWNFSARLPLMLFYLPEPSSALFRFCRALISAPPMELLQSSRSGQIFST